MSGLGKLLRSTAFRLLLAYLFVFTVFAFFTIGYVAWNARRVLDDQIVSTIEAEITGLSEQYRTGGNVAELPPGILSRPSPSSATSCIGEGPECQYRETPYGRTGETEAGAHRAIVRVFTLTGGFRLLVGRDVEERARLREVIRRAFGWSLLLVGVLGLLGGWFITRRVLKRVDDMTETTRTIMAGDLSGRLSVRGSGDE